ncbi:hypothetical protein CUMW_187850 [Citrus unshiu]|nr:hypothetical protein CUMW_187850 [Citrus unshiu]
MVDCYRSHRYKIKLKYDEFGLDEEGRKHPPMNISLDVWEYLCDIWCKEEYQTRCKKNVENRQKLPYNRQGDLNHLLFIMRRTLR